MAAYVAFLMRVFPRKIKHFFSADSVFVVLGNSSVLNTTRLFVHMCQTRATGFIFTKIEPIKKCIRKTANYNNI